MSDNAEQQAVMDQKLCVKGCGFFGSAATNYMCSKCWKVTMNQQKQRMEADPKKETCEFAEKPPSTLDQRTYRTPRLLSTAPVSIEPNGPNPSSRRPRPLFAAPLPPPPPATGIEAMMEKEGMAVDTAPGAEIAQGSCDTPVMTPPSMEQVDGGMVVGGARSGVVEGGAGGSAGVGAEGAAAAAAIAAGAAAGAVAGVVSGGASGGASSAAAGATRPVQRNRKRCFTCSKKVGYTGIACRCNYVFCALHRYPEQHDCTFDFKAADRSALKKVVVGGGQFSKVERL
ncbi:unnamed protein product [Discosporangium mesarthrocarpum]